MLHHQPWKARIVIYFTRVHFKCISVCLYWEKQTWRCILEAKSNGGVSVLWDFKSLFQLIYEKASSCQVRFSFWSGRFLMVSKKPHGWKRWPTVNSGCWPQFPTVEITGDLGPGCWPPFWTMEVSGDLGLLKTLEVRPGWEDDTGDD